MSRAIRLIEVPQTLAQCQGSWPSQPFQISHARQNSGAQISWWSRRLFTRTDSSRSFRDSYAERGEAVQHGNPNLKLGDLTIKATRPQALTQQFGTVHPCPEEASAVIVAPSLPDGSTEAL